MSVKNRVARNNKNTSITQQHSSAVHQQRTSLQKRTSQHAIEQPRKQVKKKRTKTSIKRKESTMEQIGHDNEQQSAPVAVTPDMLDIRQSPDQIVTSFLQDHQLVTDQSQLFTEDRAKEHNFETTPSDNLPSTKQGRKTQSLFFSSNKTSTEKPDLDYLSYQAGSKMRRQALNATADLIRHQNNKMHQHRASISQFNKQQQQQ